MSVSCVPDDLNILTRHSNVNTPLALNTDLVYIPVMASTNENKLTMIMPQEFRAMVNEWRRQQQDVPNFSEAVRRLILKGLKAE